MVTSLKGMTYAVWSKLPKAQRMALQDNSRLNPQLVPYIGDRVEVVTTYGETRRFWVGKSTGWVPSLLELHNTRSMGGTSAEDHYVSVKLVRRGR